METWVVATLALVWVTLAGWVILTLAAIRRELAVVEMEGLARGEELEAIRAELVEVRQRAEDLQQSLTHQLNLLENPIEATITTGTKATKGKTKITKTGIVTEVEDDGTD